MNLRSAFNLLNRKKGALLAFLTLGLLSTAAFATSTAPGGGSDTLTTLMSGWGTTLKHVLGFVEFGSGVAGVVLVVMALFHFRHGHGAQGGGQQAQTKNGFIHLVLGASLLMVGTIAAITSNTITNQHSEDITPVVGGANGYNPSTGS